MDGDVLGIAGPDTSLLQAAGRRIEARMQHGAVGLADAAENVGAALDHHAFEAAQGKTAEKRATHYADADDGKVETLERIHRDPAPRVSVTA